LSTLVKYKDNYMIGRPEKTDICCSSYKKTLCPMLKLKHCWI